MKKLLLLTKTLLAVALLCVGQNAWADNTVQNFGSTETTSWTASSLTTNIKYGSTVTLKGLVMTFGGGTYTSAQTVDGNSYSEDFWTWNSNSILPRFMPNNDGTSKGVASIAVNDVLPTNGAVYKFVLSEPGVLTISGKGGTTNGKIMLVQADNDNKVTTIVDEGSATNKEVEKTYTLDVGTYYFFQCAHNETTVSGYRYGLKSISFATLTAVSAATTWDFSSLSFSKSTTDFQLLADGTLYVGANVDRNNNQRAVFSAQLDAAPTDLGANMLCFKPSVDGQVVLRLSCYQANISVQNITDNTAVTTFNGPTSATAPDNMSKANYHGGNAYYVLATFQATANKIYSIYASTYNSNCGVFTMEFLPYANTTTALTEAASWNFMKDSNDPNYRLEEFHGITFRDFYFGTGLTWTYNSSNNTSRLLFNGNGDTSTGEKTFSFKVAANTGGEIVITPSCWYSADNNTTTNMKLTDGTNDLMEFNSTHHGKETTIIIAPAATERTLTFYQTNSSANSVGIQKISWNPVTSVSGTITPAGWASFSSSYPLDLNTISGGEAYYASAANGETVTLTPTTATVPAGEGLMIKGTPNATFTIDVAASGTAIEGNRLKATDGTEIAASPASGAGTYHYVFGYKKPAEEVTEYGFYNLAAATTVPAGKAYLEITSNGARALRISLGGITEVENIEAEPEAKAQEGKFIENGKLVIVKNGQKFNAAGAKLY